MSLHPSRRALRLRVATRLAGRIAVAGAVVLALSACGGPFAPALSGSPTPSSAVSSSPGGSPAPSVSPSVSPSGSAAPSTSPSPSVSADPSVAVTASCLSLVSLQTMYRFDPNFGLVDSYSPATGSAGSTALGYSGVACRWSQQTSGDTIDISVAHPSASALATLRSKAGAPAGASGRFFSTAAGAGTVQEFSGPYWIVATSSYFSSTADAAQLLDSVTSALG